MANVVLIVTGDLAVTGSPNVIVVQRADQTGQFAPPERIKKATAKGEIKPEPPVKEG